MRRTSGWIDALFLLLGGQSAARRETIITITHGFRHPADTEYALTDWDDTFDVPRFDPAFGELQGIRFRLDGIARGDVKIENRDASSATITTRVQARITATVPGYGALSLQPELLRSDLGSDDDGVNDQDGTSGRSFLGATRRASEELRVGPENPLVLEMFTLQPGGPTTVPVLIAATSLSQVSGPGNLSVDLATSAGVGATVTYEFLQTPSAVPEPSTVWMAALESGSMVLFRRGRRLASSPA